MTLFTTHYLLEEAEALATRLVVIDRGEVRFDGSPQAFRAQFGSRRVEYTDANGERRSILTGDTDAQVRALVRDAVPFSNLTITSTSFEESFLALTGAQQ